MIQAMEIDRKTAAFARYLEEQRKIEKTLMVERVRGMKEGLDSVFHDIKERVEGLERLNGATGTNDVAPIGWGKLIFTGSDSVSAPNTIGFGDRDETLRRMDQIRYLDDANYLVLGRNPYYVEQPLPAKSVHARAASNPSMWDTLGYVHVGYATSLLIPASIERTAVSVMSRVNALFNWAEANAVGDEWYAHVSATVRLWAAYDGEFRQAPPAEFVNLLAEPRQVRTHRDIASTAPSAALMMEVLVSAGSGTTLTVFEAIELVAATPNGHAYLDGVFAWEPLAVHLREQ